MQGRGFQGGMGLHSSRGSGQQSKEQFNHNYFQSKDLSNNPLDSIHSTSFKDQDSHVLIKATTTTTMKDIVIATDNQKAD